MGFRPEWAQLQAQDAGQLRGVVKSIQLAGTEYGAATAVRLQTAAGQIAVRGQLDVTVGQSVGIHLARHLCFSAQGQLLLEDYE